MTSKTEIANLALTKLGASRITDIGGDTTKNAREARAVFDAVRDAELRSRGWSFSLARDLIGPSGTPPAWGYTYQYPLPTDCLRVWQVGDWLFTGPDISDYRSSQGPYTIEGRNILTNYSELAGVPSPLRLRYVKRIEDTTQWDACFVEAFACRLAAELCEPITQSTSKQDIMWAQHRQALSEAKRANAIELPPEYPDEDSWITARFR